MKRMKRFFQNIFGKVVFISFFVALQVGALAAMYLYFSSHFAWYYAVCSLLSAISVLHVIGDRSNPAYKVAWSMVILAFPLFGGPFYLAFRRNRLTRREVKRSQSNEERYRMLMRGEQGDLERLKREDDEAGMQAEYLYRGASAPVYANGKSRYFSSGEDAFEQLLKDLKAAKKYIFMEYFIIEEGEMWDSILAILRERAENGVEVRVMYDDVGSLFTLPAQYDRVLRRCGIKAKSFKPFHNITNSRFNNRDHRKICVIDGRVGYTGGFNLADEYINRKMRFGYWKDTAVRVEGGAVKSLTAMFLSMWDFIHGQQEKLEDFLPEPGWTEKGEGWVQPYADSPLDDENVGENAYLNLIVRARKYAYFTTPYLILDNELITAMCLAARSGVDVRIITPRVPDKKMVFAATRSYYPVLMEAGVKIYEFLPGFIHAKMAVSDDKYAIVGTINLDFRSLFLHYECAAWFCGCQVVRDVKSDILGTMGQCEEITPERAKKIVPRRPLPAILRLFAPLM